MSDGVQKFAKDVGYSFAGLAISGAAHFVLRIFLARYLGPADLGLYTLSFTAYSFGLLLSAFGIGAALTKYVAEYKGDNPRISALVSTGSLISFIIGIIMGLMMFIAAAPIANHFFHMPQLGPLLRIIAISLPFIALEKATLGFMVGLRRMRTYAALQIFQNVLMVILTVVLVIIGYGLIGAVFALVVSIVLTSLISVFIIRKSLTIPGTLQFPQLVKMLTIFGVYVVLANGIDLINANAGNVILGYFMTDVDVGLYGTAITLFSVIRQPAAAIQTITSSTIATYWGRGEIEKIENLVNKVMKYVAAVMIPIGFVAVFFAREIITIIFGAEYAAAALPFQILVVGAVIGAIQASVGTVLSSTAYVNMIFKLGGIAVVANTMLNWLLVPRLGMSGAAIGTTVSILVVVLLNLYFAQRLVRIRIDWAWFGKLFGFTALLGGATWGLSLIINHYICIVIALGIFLVVLLKYFITREDLRIVIGAMPLLKKLSNVKHGI